MSAAREETTGAAAAAPTADAHMPASPVGTGERPHGDELDEALPLEREDVVETGTESPVEAPGPDRAHGDENDPARAGGTEERGGGPAEADGSADQLSEALRKAEEYLGLAQRAQADFDNYRKRMARENAAAVDRGVEKLAKELLPALDHLGLAIKAAEEHDAGDWLKGIRLVSDELVGALGRVGIEPFSPDGEFFDPNEHEAMAQQPAPEGVEPGTVTQVYQQGYRLNGQVLRPARVVVAGGQG